MPQPEEMMKRQQVLADFGDFAIHSDDLDAVLMEACRLVGEALGTGRAKVLEIQEGRQELLVRAGVGWASDVVGKVRLQMHDRSSETYSIRLGEPVFSQDIAKEDRFDVPPFMKDAGVVAMVNVPIFVPGERPYGILQVDDTKPRQFGEDEIQFLRTYAMILGPVIDRLHLVEERARSREKLEDSEERLRTVLEGVGEQFYALDSNCRFLFVSRSALQVWGKREEDVLGRAFLDAFPEAEGSDAYEAHRRVMRTGSAERFETISPVLHRWIEVDIAPTTQGGLSVAFRDIDDRKRAETARRESDERYRLLFDRIDEGFCIIEIIFDGSGKAIDYRFLETNAAFEQQTGLADAAGKTMRSFAPNHEEFWFETYGRIARTRKPERFEHPAEQLGHDYEVYAFPFGPPAQHRVGILFNDIAERKRAEAMLRESEDRQAFLLSLSDALGALSTPADIATLAATRLGKRLGADRVYYGEIEGECLKIQHEYTRDVQSIIGEFPMGAFGREFLAAYRAGAVIQVDDVGSDARLTDEGAAELLSRQVAAFTDVVLFESERQVCIFAVQSATPRRWTDREESLVREVAERVRSAIVRARAQAALRESEERFRRFGEASQDVIWIRDAETLQWQYLTPAFEQIYGLSREEALSGNNYRSWLDLIVPEDRSLAIENIDRVRAGEHVAFEYRIRRPIDGAVRWLRNTDFPILDEKGNVRLVGGIGHDLTELREAETRLQALVEGIPQLVWRAGEPGHWTWASPQWTTFTGQSEEDSREWGWLQALHPDDREVAREAWSRAIERGLFEAEYRICAQQPGVYRWFQTRAAPVRDDTGAIVEWLGTSTDINDLRELQARQGVMVAELQHRTRNLITVVNGVSRQTMKTATTLDEFGDRFDDRLAALSRVQGLLSHLSAGQRVTFDELLRSELTALGAPDDKVIMDGPAGVPLRSATVQTFSLALHELATNALKYGALAAPNGHLTVRWSVQLSPGADPRLQVDWRESGVVMTHVGERSKGGGYGRELIERALPYQLDAETTYELTPDGVHCTIDVPTSSARA